MSETPMYERLGTIEVPVYGLPKGVGFPAIDNRHLDTKKHMGIYVDKEDVSVFPTIVLPEKISEDGNGLYNVDVAMLLGMLDKSTANTCDEIKTDLEKVIHDLLQKATIEEVIALRGAGLI